MKTKVELEKALMFVTDSAEYDKIKADLDAATAADSKNKADAIDAVQREAEKRARLAQAELNKEHKARVTQSLIEVDKAETQRARLEEKMLTALHGAYKAVSECVSNANIIQVGMDVSHGYGQAIGEEHPEGYLPMFDSKLHIQEGDLIKVIYDRYIAVMAQITGMKAQGIVPKYAEPGRFLLDVQNQARWLYDGKGPD